MQNKGLIIIYIGKGKGKTSAAIGLVTRAAGTGLNVGIIQFIKGEWPSGERDFFNVLKDMKIPANKTLGRVDIKELGRGFVKILGDQKPFKVHQEAAYEGIKQAKQMFKSKQYNVVVLDELLSAYESKLIKLSDIEGVIKAKPKSLHLVMTGHNLPPRLKKMADLITEMKMIKHPFYKGVLAQRGIDY